MANELSFIVCIVIGGFFLLLAFVLGGSAFLSREKKAKVVAVQENPGFFAREAAGPKLAAGSRTKGVSATAYADLTALPDEARSRGTNEINQPLSHKEIFGSLSEEDADLKDLD